MFPNTLNDQHEERVRRDRRTGNFNRRIRAIAGQDERVRLRMTIPGFGPVTATAPPARHHRSGKVPRHRVPARNPAPLMPRIRLYGLVRSAPAPLPPDPGLQGAERPPFPDWGENNSLMQRTKPV